MHRRRLTDRQYRRLLRLIDAVLILAAIAVCVLVALIVGEIRG